MFGPKVTVLDSNLKLYTFDAEIVKTGKLPVARVLDKLPKFMQNFVYKSRQYLTGYHKEAQGDSIFLLNLDTAEITEVKVADSI